MGGGGGAGGEGGWQGREHGVWPVLSLHLQQNFVPVAEMPQTKRECAICPVSVVATLMLMHAAAFGRRTPSASLVLAWEKKIYLMDVPLAAAAQPVGPDPSSPSPKCPATPPPARVLKSWDIEHVVSHSCQVFYCLACCHFLH